jgi:hypothetical protein
MIRKIPAEWFFNSLVHLADSVYCDRRHFGYVLERVHGGLTESSLNELFYDFDENLDGFLDVNEIGQMILKVYG